MRSKEQMISLMMRHVLACSRVDVQSNPSRYAEELPPAESSCRTRNGQHRLMKCHGNLTSQRPEYTRLSYGKASATPKRQTLPWEIVRYFASCWVGTFRNTSDDFQLSWNESISRLEQGPDGIAGDKFLELFKDRKMWTVPTDSKEAADCVLVEKSQEKGKDVWLHTGFDKLLASRCLEWRTWRWIPAQMLQPSHFLLSHCLVLWVSLPHNHLQYKRCQNCKTFAESSELRKA